MNKYDVNNDGRVNKYDKDFIQQYVAKLFNLNTYDINDDGDINISDYMEWRRHYDLSDIDNNGLLQETDANLILNAINKRTTTLRMDLNNDNEVNLDDVCQLQLLTRNASALSKKLDVNNDGVISEIDGILLRKIVDVCREILYKMDVNKDGKINVGDAGDIEKHFKK